jgi:hypothetical protein
LIGAEDERSTIPEAVPVEGAAPEIQEAAGAAPEPAEVASGGAPAMTEEERDELLPESNLEVVICSPEIQDADRSVRHRCPRPPRLVVVGSSFWRMISSTRRQ